MSLGYTVSRAGLPVVALPNGLIESLRWRQVTRADIQSSPTTGRQQVNQLPGSKWLAEYSYPALMGCDDCGHAGLLRAFLAKLGGRHGRFLAHDVSWINPDYNNLTLSGSLAAGATSLSFSGANNLRLSDWFQVVDGLYMVTEDVSGSTIQFEPPVVHPVSSGVRIECQQPGVIMRLNEQQQDYFTISGRRERYGTVAFSAVEAKS